MSDNINASPIQREVIATGADRISGSKTGITSSAVVIVNANSTRRTLWINNLGSTYLWVGGSNNITPGVTGVNFGHLNADNNTEVEHYRGIIYGVVGASAVTVGVSSVGSSIAPCWVAVLDIG